MLEPARTGLALFNPSAHSHLLKLLSLDDSATADAFTASRIAPYKLCIRCIFNHRFSTRPARSCTCRIAIFRLRMRTIAHACKLFLASNAMISQRAAAALQALDLDRYLMSAREVN